MVMMADFMLYIFYHIFMGLNKIKASEVEKRKFPSFLTALQRKYETLPKIYKSQSTVAPGYLSDLTPVPPYSPFPAYCIHSHGGLASFPQAGHLISKTPNQPGTLFLQLRWMVPSHPSDHLLWEALPANPIQVSWGSLVTFSHMTLRISFQHFWPETNLSTRLLAVSNLLMDKLRRVGTLSALFRVISHRA